MNNTNKDSNNIKVKIEFTGLKEQGKAIKTDIISAYHDRDKDLLISALCRLDKLLSINS